MKEEEIKNKTKVGVGGEYQGGNGRQGGGRWWKKAKARAKG